MKKLYYLLSLCLAFVSIAMPAYADGGTWTGKGIKSVGDAATKIETGKYYLMHNTGRSWWIAEGDGVLTGISVSSDDLTSTNLTTAFYGTTYMSSVVYVGGATDAYTFQFQSGNYMGVLNWNSQASTSSTAETFTIGTIEDSYFTILDNTTVEYTYWSWDSESYVTTTGQQYLDGNATTPIGWNSATTTTGNGANGAYQFFEVTLVDVYTVTYNLKDSDGNIISTKDYYIMPGDSYPYAPTSVDGLYTISSDNVPTGEVTKDSICNFTVTYESNPAFTVSSSTDAATWYGIVTRGGTKYLATNDDNSYIDLSTTWKAAAGSFDAYANVQNNRLWCIMGNPFDGFELYNKYAGKYISMSNTTNGTSATMVSTSSDNTKFDIVCNSSNYLFKKHGSDNAFLSDYADKNPNTLRMWNSASALTDNSGAGDAGSIMQFVAADNLDLAAANIPAAPTSALLDAEKTYTPSVVSAFDFTSAQEETSKTNEELYNAYYQGVQGNTYYKIRVSRHDVDYSDEQYRWISSYQTKAYTTGLFKDDSGNYKARPVCRVRATDDEIPMLFTFEEQEGETSNAGYQKYRIRNANTGLVLAPVGSSDMVSLEYEGTASNYWLELVSGTNDEWILKTSEGTNGNNAYGGVQDANAVTMSSYSQTDKGSHFYIIPVTNISLVIYDDTKYASACYPFAVELPSGLTAYAVSEDDGSEATLTAIGSSVVPAKTPVFITAGSDATATSTDSDAGTSTYTLTINPTDKSTYEGTNLLNGTTVSREGFAESTATSGTAFYALTTNGTEAVMRKNGSVTTMPANKAYYPFSLSSSTESTKPMTLYFNMDDEATGINTVSTSEATEDSNKYYDLNGRRVFYPAHGIFVKANGQKVYVK